MLLVSVAGSATASSRAIDPPRIVPWHEIGNIGLGMSHARVERVYGPAINGSPPRNTIVWQYRGRGVIEIEYDANGHVESIDTASRAYATRSGIQVGLTVPLGPCHRVGGKCRHRWRGFTFSNDGGPQFREWDRIATFGHGPVRVVVQLFTGSGDTIQEIALGQYLHCSWGDVVATSCRKPPPPPVPPADPGLRYCRPPAESGAYLEASPGVTCATARQVEATVFSDRCYNRTVCDALGFTCVAYWGGRYDRPFSFTHHAVCRDPNDERIVMDES